MTYSTVNMRGARTLACRVGTRADAVFISCKACREESRHGTQECVRHIGKPARDSAVRAPAYGAKRGRRSNEFSNRSAHTARPRDAGLAVRDHVRRGRKLLHQRPRARLLPAPGGASRIRDVIETSR